MFRRATGVLKANLNEFKEFAFKGNLIQLAIGVVLGGAFGNLITSFVKNIFVPLLELVTGSAGKGGYGWEWKGIHVGQFIGDLISFVIIALAIFLLMVKVIGWIVKLTAKAQGPDKEGEPTEKECPYCLMKVPAKARRCGHCTSDIADTVGPALNAPISG
jgi:large conductance mechanosensitive channel